MTLSLKAIPEVMPVKEVERMISNDCILTLPNFSERPMTTLIAAEYFMVTFSLLTELKGRLAGTLILMTIEG